MRHDNTSNVALKLHVSEKSCLVCYISYSSQNCQHCNFCFDCKDTSVSCDVIRVYDCKLMTILLFFILEVCFHFVSENNR